MSIESLEYIKNEENLIRYNLYREEYAQHDMNTNPYYNLIEITEEIWNRICIRIMEIKEDGNLYFPDARLQLRKRITRSWKDVQNLAKDNKISYHFQNNDENVFIAGGKALATLLTVPCTDVDYFSTKEIQPWEIKAHSDYFTITPQVINFEGKKQLIKRLYKVPHEIVHSFDIDCCSVLINKDGRIFGSKRFIYSLINGYNTVDFNYFSPSYEWRLIKYSNRGFSVSVPSVVNCKNPDSLYTQTSSGMCFPDSIWSYADINDLLGGSMLRSILMNAKGIQKILIASAIANPSTSYELEESQPHTYDNKNPSRRLNKLTNKQLSDYEEDIGATDTITGKINLNGIVYYLDGAIGYDDNGIPNSYKGIFTEPNNGYQNVHEFSPNLQIKLINILNSPYRRVNPGEQTTSTFHKIVLDDPNQWYTLNKFDLFENSLYTFLYFRGISNPPSLYDEKVTWFGPEATNLFIYHFARLFLNQRIYNKFNNLEITELKIAFGDIRPKSIIYHAPNGYSEEFFIPHQDSKGIFRTLLLIGSKYSIFSQKEIEMLMSLDTRTKEGIIPKIEPRGSINH